TTRSRHSRTRPHARLGVGRRRNGAPPKPREGEVAHPEGGAGRRQPACEGGSLRGRQPAARPGRQRRGGGSATGGNPVARLVASSDRQSHSTGWTRGQRDPRERLDTSPAGGRPRPERKRGRAAGGPPQGRRPTAVAGCESTRQADSSSL